MKILILLPLLYSLHSWSKSSNNRLTLHLTPSPRDLDWRSPRDLIQSALKNKLTLSPRLLGHAIVELNCDSDHHFVAMSGKDMDYINQLIIQRKGLGILFHSFQGELLDNDDLRNEVKALTSSGDSNFVTFLLTPSQCQRSLKYLQEYRENNVGRYYGLSNRPRFGEGGSSSAFAVSFLDVLNLLDQEMKDSWRQIILVPLKFSGPPLKDEGVGIIDIMLNARSWAKENENHRKLVFWDPDLMHQWVKKKIEQKENGYDITTIGTSSGVVFDKSHFPSPPEGIWLQRLKPGNAKVIDDN